MSKSKLRRIFLILATIVSGSISNILPAQKALPNLALGYTTHFSQGWPQKTFFLINAARPLILRDGLNWSAIERAPGRYNFSPATTDYIKMACRRGIKPVVTISMSNSLYDGGQTVYTETGRTALARFVRASADEFSGCDCSP